MAQQFDLRLRDWLAVLLTPSCWLQNCALDAGWDRELRWLLDNGYRFHDIDKYHARIGDYEVWIANYPYAAFRYGDIRPRRATIIRAWKVLAADRFPKFTPRRTPTLPAQSEIG